MPQESIKNTHTSGINFSPKMIGEYKFNSKVEFKGICLKQDNVSFLRKEVVTLYISYKLDTWSKNLDTDLY